MTQQRTQKENWWLRDDLCCNGNSLLRFIRNTTEIVMIIAKRAKIGLHSRIEVLRANDGVCDVLQLQQLERAFDSGMFITEMLILLSATFQKTEQHNKRVCGADGELELNRKPQRLDPNCHEYSQIHSLK